MPFAAVQPISAPSTGTSSGTQASATNFSQKDFLKVLVAQLSQQDPFKAGDSSQIMNQFMSLANLQATQESALATKNTGTSVDALRNLDLLSLAQKLTGTHVQLTTATGQTVSGTVDQVNQDPATQNLTLTVGGQSYPLQNLQAILYP